MTGAVVVCEVCGEKIWLEERNEFVPYVFLLSVMLTLTIGTTVICFNWFPSLNNEIPLFTMYASDFLPLVVLEWLFVAFLVVVAIFYSEVYVLSAAFHCRYTIRKTSDPAADQIAICKAVNEMKETIRKKHEQERERKEKLQKIADGCR